MKTQHITLKGNPALLIGEPSRKVYLYVHGKMGSKEEALAFAEQAWPAGYQVLQFVYQYAKVHWRKVALRATSIGAWFSMLALAEKEVTHALFVSPVVDMEALITNMMKWANVTEAQLKEAGELPTSFGETLSWPYLCWVREHPVRWNTPTQVLYPGEDNLTSRAVIERFRQQSGAHLTILEGAEHWLHTESQLAALQVWEGVHL